MGTDLLIASVMKLFGGGLYALRGEVHWPTVRWLACGSIPGALVGVWLLNQLSGVQLELFLKKAVGVALLLAGGSMLLRALWRPGSTSGAMPRPWVTVLLGAAVGVLVSVTTTSPCWRPSRTPRFGFRHAVEGVRAVASPAPAARLPRCGDACSRRLPVRAVTSSLPSAGPRGMGAAGGRGAEIAPASSRMT